MFIPILFFLVLIGVIEFFLNLNLMLAATFVAYFSLAMLVIYFFSVLVDAYRLVFFGSAPFVKSSRKFIALILSEINIPSSANVYELGCGDASFLRAVFAKTRAHCVGYEFSLAPYLMAKISTFFVRKNIVIRFENFFKADLSGADYIFCFLLPGEMLILEKKLKRELKLGCVVVSNTFTFQDWQPEKTVVLNPGKKNHLSNKLYIYRK